MNGPEFVRPASLDEAIGILSSDAWGTKVISGGTAVVLMLRQGLIAPDTLVSINDIPNLSGIAEEAGQIRIGATTPLRDVAASRARPHPCTEPCLRVLRRGQSADPQHRHACWQPC